MPEPVASRPEPSCGLEATGTPPAVAAPLALVEKASTEPRRPPHPSVPHSAPADAGSDAPDPRVLRPKNHVDWSAQKLACPHAAKAHGNFSDIDAFCRHIVYECDAPTAAAGAGPGLPLSPLTSPGSTASTASVQPSPLTCEGDSANLQSQFPSGALEHTGYLGAVADPEALAAGRYTATVTVSPCSRWYTAENTCRLVDFALQASEGPVLVMISDNINCLNEGVKGKAISAATRQQERAGRKFQSEVEAALATRLDEANLARISFAGFRAWMRQHDGGLQAAADRDAVVKLYATDDAFAQAVDDYCEPWSHKPWRPTTHFHRACAVQYFLEELASLCVPAEDKALEMEVYAQSERFQGCAPRDMALARLFPRRTQRVHAIFSDASLNGGLPASATGAD